MLKKHLPLQLIITLCLTVGVFSQSNLVGRASKLHAPTAEWSIALIGQAVRESSPVLVDITSAHAGNEIIVAGGDGRIYAYRANGINLWEHDTGSAIESSPAVGDIDGDGDMEIVVGLGSQYETGEDGGVICLDHTGQQVWRFTDVEDHHGSAGDGSDGHPDGVYSTPALGDLDNNGDLEIIFGAWDHWLRSLNHDGTLLWSVFLRDTITSSPALGDIDRDGYLEIVIGSDAHAESAFGTPNGGSIHAFTRDGAEMSGFPQHIDEIIQSSPALGDINGDGWLEIVVGTGNFYGAGHQVHAWDHDGNYVSGWPKAVGDYVFSSPALGDIDNDGLPDVVVGCNDHKIYAWKGDGTQIFAITAQTHSGTSSWGVRTSPILADYDNDGQVEVLYSYHNEIRIIDYSSGWANSDYLATNGSINSSPAIGNIDGDGNIELVVAGQRNWSATQGEINAWQLDLDDDSSTKLPWPMFHRDAARNGHLPVAPVLSVSPASLDFMHQTGDTTEPTLSLLLTNTGDCATNWTASAPGGLDVTPGSGTIEATVIDYDVVNVTVLNPTSYTPGTTHNLGSVTVNGTSSCGTVESRSVAAIFYASDFSRIYLPAVMRQYVPVLYSDDFSNPASGWPIAEDSKTGSGYFGLEYGVHISDIDSDYPRAVAQGPFYASGDYAVQVEARGTTMAFARCGIIFNASADMSRYDYFFIDNRYPTDPNQGSKLRRYQNGSHKALKAKPVNGTTVELYEPNTLRVKVVGSQIQAYVDGVQILSYDDSSPPGGGYIGLYAEHAYYGSPSSPSPYYHKANCHFDNLIVTRP